MAAPKKIGIYQIKSNLNNRIYIGSSIDIRRRWKIHKSQLSLGNHHSIILQRHYDKYGKDDLVFSILELCEEDNLIKVEQAYLDHKKPYFNIRKTADSNKGIVRTEETKQKIRAFNLGKKLSDETRLKMSLRMKGNQYTNGIPAKNSKKVICEQTGVVFNKIQDAADYLGIKRTTLNAKLSGQNKNNTTLKYL